MTIPSLNIELTAILSKAFETCGYDADAGEVVPCNHPQWGHYQCNGALSLAKTLKKDPKKIAQEVIKVVGKLDLFKEISVSGPGFIVMTLDEAFLTNRLEVMATDPRLGIALTPWPKNVIIDFGGPNVAKPMHVGHLRSTAIGDCLQRLFRFMGDSVQSDIHLGDWGLPMGMLIEGLKRLHPGLPYFDATFNGNYPSQSPATIQDLEALYPEAAQFCSINGKALAAAQKATAELQNKRRGYLALWRHIVAVSKAALKTDFDNLDVAFDLWHGESRYHDRITPLLRNLEKEGIARKSQGALVINVSRDTDNKPMPPLMLKKKDGSYLYDTTDLAALDERLNDMDADRVLYVVDQRQHLHFEQVFRAATLAGFKHSACMEHIGFGTVNGIDGTPLKTRQGGTVKLHDLIVEVRLRVRSQMDDAQIAKSYKNSERAAIIDKVAVATLKYADLMNNRMSDYIFDLDKFTRFEGKTGPYCLINAVRIKSIIRKASEQNCQPGPLIDAIDAVENALRFQLLRLPEIVQKAYDKREPHHLCLFAYELAKNFSRFYKQHHVLNEPDPTRQSSWISLSELCLRELELVLGLLGIDIPMRM